MRNKETNEEFAIVRASARWHGEMRVFDWRPVRSGPQHSIFSYLGRDKTPPVFISFWRPEFKEDELFFIAAPTPDSDGILALAPDDWSHLNLEEPESWLALAREKLGCGSWGRLCRGDFYAANGQMFHEPPLPSYVIGCNHDPLYDFETALFPCNWRWASSEQSLEILCATPPKTAQDLWNHERVHTRDHYRWFKKQRAEKTAFLPSVELAIEVELAQLMTWIWASNPFWRSEQAQHREWLLKDHRFWRRTRFVAQQPDPAEFRDYGALICSDESFFLYLDRCIRQLWPHFIRGLAGQIAKIESLHIQLENREIMACRSDCAYKVRFEPPTFHEAMDARFCLQQWLAERADFHEKLD